MAVVDVHSMAAAAADVEEDAHSTGAADAEAEADVHFAAAAVDVEVVAGSSEL